MAADPNYGWVRVNNDDFRLAFEDSQFTFEFVSVNADALPQDTVVGWSFGTTKRLLRLINVRAKTQADIETIIDKLKDLDKTGSPYLLQWQVNSGGAAGDFFAFDGDTRSMYVLCKKGMNLTKEAKGDGTIYKIPILEFIEAEK